MPTKFEIIKQYFTTPPIKIEELKQLTPEDRAELAELAAKELGLTIDAPVVNK